MLSDRGCSGYTPAVKCGLWINVVALQPEAVWSKMCCICARHSAEAPGLSAASLLEPSSTFFTSAFKIKAGRPQCSASGSLITLDSLSKLWCALTRVLLIRLWRLSWWFSSGAAMILKGVCLCLWILFLPYQILSISIYILYIYLWLTEFYGKLWN